MFWNTFLSILGVIGIIAVSAFVIVFLSDLFISIVDGTNGIFFKRNKNKVADEEEEQYSARPKMLDEPVKQIEEKKEVEEPKEEKQEEPTSEQEQEVDMAKAEEEEALAKQAMGVVEPAPTQEPVKEEPKEDEKLEKFIAQINEETKEALEKEIVPVQEIVKEEDANQQVVAENEDLKRELEELRKQIESDKETIRELEELKKQIEDDQATIKSLEEKQDVQTIKVPSESREELEARLEVLKQRLKENEKELSANRKEFVPLRRVNMTLESDKKKLRRKEAIVAKQKVVLYGVNNYVDIDEEKAKKLSEELDLLEGLRLSVQHCEEVMQKNKDRYPILESANKFLVRSQSQLKEDIADIENKLALLDNKDDEDDNK